MKIMEPKSRSSSDPCVFEFELALLRAPKNEPDTPPVPFLHRGRGVAVAVYLYCSYGVCGKAEKQYTRGLLKSGGTLQDDR